MFKKILERLMSRRGKLNLLDSRVLEFDAFFILNNLILSGFRSVFFHFQNPMKLNVIGKGVSIICKRKLVLGDKCIIGNHVSISCLGDIGVVIGSSVSIGDFSKFVVSSDITNLGAFIRIDDGVGIGEFARIGGSGGVTISKNTIIGQYFSCHPENHIFSDPIKPIKEQGTIRAPIFIDENCWIGAKVTILAGSKIGRHSVVAAGSVVSGEFPPYSVIGGIPAKVIKEIKSCTL
ncbi:acyltransferase [Shewanella sp. SG44-6]|uniref:acyltransferase n=1 Tax=Shewanella sp. SG44-6 TaxID=2760959 RepID=UPI00160099FF|nr:acyltransferase [Shewanella sp. SG44-6]MBB1391324.1 acyltransferase [Shewanella sp. SG44-6]